MARKQPTMKEKLAAALLQLIEFRNGKWEPTIDRGWAKGKTPEEIIARFECDHYPISVFLGGTNHPTNLTWRTKEEHREKTDGHDAKVHAKIRRNKKKQEKERQPMSEGERRRSEYAKVVYEERKRKRKAWLASLNRGKKK